MSRASQISDQRRIAAYFRTLFRAEKDLTPGLADRLATRAAARIKRMVIWDGETDDPALAPSTSAPAAQPPAGDDSPPAQPVANEAAAMQPAAAQPAEPLHFDPYAFSVVVVLTKSGKDGLMKRLATIDRPEHLKKLADAQHLALDGSLSTLADLRAAIVKAAEIRIANRRAAAS